jgi:hypothetical protein
MQSLTLQAQDNDFDPLDLGLHPPLAPLKVYSYRSADSPALAALLDCVTAADNPPARLESLLVAQLASCSAATDTPHHADFFFVPARPACLASAGHSAQEVSALYKAAVESLPHFQLTGGRNHVFAFVTSEGPYAFPEWCASLPQSLTSRLHQIANGLVCEANTREFAGRACGRSLLAMRNVTVCRYHYIHNAIFLLPEAKLPFTPPEADLEPLKRPYQHYKDVLVPWPVVMPTDREHSSAELALLLVPQELPELAKLATPSSVCFLADCSSHAANASRLHSMYLPVCSRSSQIATASLFWKPQPACATIYSCSC